MRHLEALAAFFGVPVAYFFDAEVAARADADLELVVALSNRMLRDLAVDAADVSPPTACRPSPRWSRSCAARKDRPSDPPRTRSAPLPRPAPNAGAHRGDYSPAVALDPVRRICSSWHAARSTRVQK